MEDKSDDRYDLNLILCGYIREFEEKSDKFQFIVSKQNMGIFQTT